ncbi:MAG: hypothetical protein AB1606_07420 [Nitrospirota bacterium]
MRNISWKIIVVMIIILLLKSPAFAEGLSGWANLNYLTTEQFEDDERIATSSSFYRNLYLSLSRPITPLLSYQLYFRTNWLDSSSTDSEGKTTKTYQRAAEPALDFFLRNPMYDLSTGYRRQEQWSTAHLRDESRRTTEYYYSRFDIRPQALPSLSLQVDRQRDYDHLSTKKIDSTGTRYSGISGYIFSYRDLKLSYNLTYTRNVNETPLSTTSKSIYDSFTGLYNLGYSRSFWDGKTNISAGYQGNYVRNKSQLFVTQTGSVLFERTPFGGLHGVGTASEPNVGELTSELSLIDNNFNTGITKINISTQKYHNIGIWISSEKSVDRLYIYVNKNVSSDTNLTNTNNWRVYRSNSNLSGTWTEITIQAVAVSAYDVLNSIYRYEIRFSTSQSASYFKAVNMETVSGITDVLVTEIEAYGTDVVPETGILADVATFFTQGLSLSANLRPITKLNFSFNYFINRSDQDPISLWDSIGGIFENIFSKSVEDPEGKLRSNITRTYGAASTWLTHRLLTTAFRLQRSEAFDNKNETDISSNTYSLAFSSSPLPTLDTNLSFIRSDSYSFNEKQSTSDSILLSALSKLYRDVNMVTDIGYTQSKSYVTDILSSTKSIRGSLDARLTQKLYGNFIYGLSWTSSDDISSSTKEGAVIVTYRPGRFINLTGNFRVSDVNGNTTASEGFLIDWLPLPAIRLNLNYQHSSTEPGPLTSDSFSGYGIWYITKFMDIQFTYGYTRSVKEKETVSYNLGVNLNLRFW